MMKQAWRSYWASLHPRNLRKAYDKGAFFQLLYWFVIYPLIMNAVSDNMEFYDIVALMFMRMIPFLIMEWSNLGSKYLMTKKMYLSPMKEQERKEYINHVLFIKIGTTVMLGVCIELIWEIFTGFHMGKVVCMALVNVSIGIATYMSGKKSGSNIFILLMSILSMFAIACLEVGAEESLAIVCNWFIVIAIIILLVLDIVLIHKNYQATIALAGEYEATFKIEKKVDATQVKYDLFAKKE